jgi:lysophospholipase L1-like esterase
MKKFISIVLAIVLLASGLALLQGCGEEESTAPLKIVFLGDSISEGLAGPMPLSERENYSFYALLGRCNHMEYYNRAVSGQKTKQFLGLISREDDSAYITNTLIRDADILHISITGNDLLQNNMTQMAKEAANNDFTYIDQLLEDTRKDFADAIARLKELNPDALIIINTVYNPVLADQPQFSKAAEYLAERGWTPDRYHEMGNILIGRLNTVITNYLKEHPGAYIVADAFARYNQIYQSDFERFKRLPYPDLVHPSNEGHAVIMELLQQILIEQGLASEDALSVYKQIKTEQLERMYAETLNVRALKRKIRHAQSFDEVTLIYFNATDGIAPDYC